MSRTDKTLLIGPLQSPGCKIIKVAYFIPYLKSLSVFSIYPNFYSFIVKRYTPIVKSQLVQVRVDGILVSCPLMFPEVLYFIESRVRVGTKIVEDHHTGEGRRLRIRFGTGHSVSCRDKGGRE